MKPKLEMPQILVGKKSINVGTIFCAAKNYADHAAEMNAAPPLEPVFFIKPVTALTTQDQTVKWPSHSKLIHHEVELAVIIGKSGSNVNEDEAKEMVAGYCVAVDLTARDVQAGAKKAGKPWFAAKGFDGSCPISTGRSIEDCPKWENVELSLEVNGHIRQKGDAGQMLFTPFELIASLSKIVTLRSGDLVLTGTPAGVGPLEPGDKIRAKARGIGVVEFVMGG